MRRNRGNDPVLDGRSCLRDICMYIYIYIYMLRYICINIYLYTCICIYVCIHECNIHTCVCMYVCIFFSCAEIEGMIPFWMDGRGSSVVANDLTLSGMVVLTGPNTAGKSTIMRSVNIRVIVFVCLFVSRAL